MGVAPILMASLFGVASNHDGELLAMEHVRTFSMFFSIIKRYFPKTQYVMTLSLGSLVNCDMLSLKCE